VALLATGGSTNHTLHLVAIAKAAGIVIDWNDFDELSRVVPLLTRIYPNGDADVNHFHAAGGTGFVIRELLDAGLLHDDVTTILGKACVPTLPSLSWARMVRAWCGKTRRWNRATKRCCAKRVRHSRPTAAWCWSGQSGPRRDESLGREARAPHGGSTGAGIHSQEAFMADYKAGKLDRDFVAVIRFQGPRANGMPELHALTPALANLQDAGRHVALVTDGRMSGASGKVPAAIHVSPEILAGGPLGLVRDGDLIRLCANTGTLEALVDSAVWHARAMATADLSPNQVGMGRELFAMFRNSVCEPRKVQPPSRCHRLSLPRWTTKTR
jgi:phosphogluconate dehydratase